MWGKKVGGEFCGVVGVMATRGSSGGRTAALKPVHGSAPAGYAVFESSVVFNKLVYFREVRLRMGHVFTHHQRCVVSATTITTTAATTTTIAYCLCCRA